MINYFHLMITIKTDNSSNYKRSGGVVVKYIFEPWLFEVCNFSDPCS